MFSDNPLKEPPSHINMIAVSEEGGGGEDLEI